MSAFLKAFGAGVERRARTVRTTYLNNAATSYPKPEVVVRAMTSVLTEVPAVEPGRSVEGVDLLGGCRTVLADLFEVDDPRKVTLLPSATSGLNLVISGLLPPSAHCVTTTLEHNSVLRPLVHAGDRGCSVTRLEPDEQGQVAAAAVAEAITERTALVAITHASNVTGVIQPVEQIAQVCAEAGTPLLIDASQSAGCVSLSHRSLPGRVFVAFAGHKGLMGPPGTGGLIVPDDELDQRDFGGTGVRSEAERHPGELPLRHEAGTPNLPGIAGLRQGARFVRDRGVEALGRVRARLVAALRGQLANLDGLWLSPLADGDGRAGIVALNLEGWPPEELSFVLLKVFSIETRSGLHCAPLAHRSLGTAPLGSIRVSFGPFNTDEDVRHLVGALREVNVT